MKLQFENLPHQQEAIDSTIQLFEGVDFSLPLLTSTVGVVTDQGVGLIYDNGVGISIRTGGQEEVLLKNLTNIQKRNQIPIQNLLDGKGKLDGSSKMDGLPKFQEIEGLEDIANFTIEMETGTGKTYVYIRSMLELNRHYGLSHFIIVVPSIAIREGVKKTLEITQNHFKELGYNAIEFLEYNSRDKKPTQKIKDFVNKTSSVVKCLILNMDSFNKVTNNLNKEREDFDNGMFEGEEGNTPIGWIKSVNPVVILDEPQNMGTGISKMALKALNPKFILRYSATHKETANLIYSLNPIDSLEQGLVKTILVESLKVDNSNNPYIKLIGINKDWSVKVKLYNPKGELKDFTIKAGDDLGEKTKNTTYAGYILDNDINKETGIKILGITDRIKLGKDNSPYQKETERYKIEKVVRQHFKKQNKLKDKGIKVLSLFFIDTVSDYRIHSKEDSYGELAKIFEEVFREVQSQGRNKEIIPFDVRDVHSGYFSKDKQGNFKKNQDDRDTYTLIMKDKERLLSLEEPVSFIFSHSALKEGWDNPNVFQICSLRESNAENTKRQQLGRGLRICVNQQGERVYDKDINELYVVANESYEEFAKALQQEYKDAGYKFTDEENNTLTQNAKNERTLEAKNLENPEFKKLWNLINQKTYYSIYFDTQTLIDRCSKGISLALKEIEPIKITSQTHKLDFNKNVEDHKAIASDTVDLKNLKIPPFITEIANKTELTRRTIVNILKESKSVEQIKKNPIEFISKVSQIIRQEMTELLLDGVQYKKLDGSNFDSEEWDIKTFRKEEDELILNVDKDDLRRTMWEQILLDSATERDFVKNNFFRKEWVSFFFKLPSWFKIKTPIGYYNPDFAYTKEGKDYAFIREVKATKNEQDLRPIESAKIKYGKKHFTALSDDKIDFSFGD